MNVLRSLKSALAAHRILLGVLIGTVSWFVPTVISGQPSGLTPWASIMLAMMIAGIYDPGRAACLGSLIGLAAGGYQAVLSFQENFQPANAFEWAGLAIIFYLFILFSMASFALAGALLGIYVKSYRRGIVF